MRGVKLILLHSRIIGVDDMFIRKMLYLQIISKELRKTSLFLTFSLYPMTFKHSTESTEEQGFP